MGLFAFVYLLFFTAGIALGQDVNLLPTCTDVQVVPMTWAWFAKIAAGVAGSMGTIHVVTNGLMALPFVQQYTWLFRVLQIVSVLGFNKAKPGSVCTAGATVEPPKAA